MALPEHLAPPPDGIPDDAEDRPWRCQSAPQAEWLMRKLAAARRRLAATEAERDDYLAQVAAWFEQATAADRKTAEWATGHLADWALGCREADPEAKTQRLPSGRVHTRWVNARPVVADAGLVAEAFARTDHPAYDEIVRARIVIDTPALTRHTRLDADGNVVLDVEDRTYVVMGVEVAPGHLTASVDPA
jgi:hypothetical protein